MRLRFFAFWLGLFALLWTARAEAFTPPPLNGHVIDTAGVLSREQVLVLDRKLDRARRDYGFAVVVFIPGSLEGESIEDVAYKTFNTWKVGSAKGDDGVLLVIAPKEHKTQIETGKGVGGALTDLQSSHINRDVINPLLKQGRFYDAVDRGTDAIVSELVSGTPGGTSDPGRAPGKHATETSGSSSLHAIGILAVLGLVIVLAIVSPTFRQILFFVLLFGRGGGGGGGRLGLLPSHLSVQQSRLRVGPQFMGKSSRCPVMSRVGFFKRCATATPSVMMAG